MVPINNQSLLIKNSTQEINETFMQMGEANFTFKDLIQGSVELPLRLYTQYFTHGKASRYMRPHRRIVAMLTKAVTSRHRLSLNFAKVILTEMKAYAGRLRQSKGAQNPMNCGLMLTRVAYFAVGMLEDLPPTQPLKQWLEQNQNPLAKTVRDRTESSSSTRTQAQDKKKAQEKDKESKKEETKEEREDTESSNDSKRTKSKDETTKKIKLL